MYIITSSQKNKNAEIKSKICIYCHYSKHLWSLWGKWSPKLPRQKQRWSLIRIGCSDLEVGRPTWYKQPLSQDTSLRSKQDIMHFDHVLKTIPNIDEMHSHFEDTTQTISNCYNFTMPKHQCLKHLSLKQTSSRETYSQFIKSLSRKRKLITHLSTIEQSCSWTILASTKSPFRGKHPNHAGTTCIVPKDSHYSNHLQRRR